jgi:hypothetical protein
MIRLEWRDAGEGIGEIRREGGHALARYSWLRANHPYVDELRPLGHTGVLTAHAPHDHRWHHGLWWSWKYVNDVLFWEDHPGFGGNRAGLGRCVVTRHTAGSTAGEVVIEQELEWRVDGTGTALLGEHRVIRAAADSGVDGAWRLDWEQAFTALEDVVFDVTPWPETSWGGYAGLNYRPARSMAEGETVLGAGGRRGAAAVHGEPLAWASYHGMADGAETDDPDHPAIGGVALVPIASRPEVPFYAAGAAGGFGFLATAPLMRDGLELRAGGRHPVRTRVLILGSAADAEAIDLAARRLAAVPAGAG